MTNKYKYKYRHPNFQQDWETIDWPYPVTDGTEDEIAMILAEDWAEEDAESLEICSIFDDIEIERVDVDCIVVTRPVVFGVKTNKDK